MSEAGNIHNRAGIVKLSVVCEAEYTAPCDRCGCHTVRKHNIPIERVLVNEINDGENDEIILLQDMKLDITELCFEEVILGIGSKHLCKEDCKGLCQTCGKNLNEGSCDCSKKEIDPRFQKLAEIFKETDNGC